MWSNNKEKSALIAMSGGVDSSVAAYLMQQRGFRCEGTTMRLYRNADIGLSQFHTCCSQRDIDDAAEVAFQLDIPYEVLDFTMDFKSRVIEKFIRIYESGGTPNPCIDCNRYMKFDSLLRFAEEKGLETIVTGHYARVEYDGELVVGGGTISRVPEEGSELDVIFWIKILPDAGKNTAAPAAAAPVRAAAARCS